MQPDGGDRVVASIRVLFDGIPGKERVLEPVLLRDIWARNERLRRLQGPAKRGWGSDRIAKPAPNGGMVCYNPPFIEPGKGKVIIDVASDGSITRRRVLR